MLIQRQTLVGISETVFSAGKLIWRMFPQLAPSAGLLLLGTILVTSLMGQSFYGGLRGVIRDPNSSVTVQIPEKRAGQ